MSMSRSRTMVMHMGMCMRMHMGPRMSLVVLTVARELPVDMAVTMAT